jgi:hypothetical protein
MRHADNSALRVLGSQSRNLVLQNNAYLLGTCNYWCDKAFSAYEVLSGVNIGPLGPAMTSCGQTQLHLITSLEGTSIACCRTRADSFTHQVVRQSQSTDINHANNCATVHPSATATVCCLVTQVKQA